MKRVIAASLATVFFVAAAATAQARVDVSVNIGVPVVTPAPPPVVVADYRPDPFPVAQPEFYLDEPPRFIFSPRLGFHVSVGIPYDIAYLNNGYYLYRGGYWYGAPSYAGPWTMVSQRRLPHPLRQHRYEDIRHHRDYEYRSYLRDRDRYRGTWYQPVRAGYKPRHDQHRDRWEERKDHRWKDREDRWKERGERRDGREAYRDGYRDGRRDDRRDDRRDHR